MSKSRQARRSHLQYLTSSHYRKDGFAELSGKSGELKKTSAFRIKRDHCVIVKQFVCGHCKSSSHFGMSKTSANSGGRVSFIQFTLNQSRWAACFAPRLRSSGSLIRRLDSSCGSLAWFLLT